MGISRREFAKREGCTEGTIRNGISRGKLKPLEDGTLDERLVGSGWRKKTAQGAQGAQRVEAAAPIPSTGGVLSFADAQTRKENYLAQLRQLEFETKSGRLVDAEEVKRLAFEWERDTRDYWANWPAMVSAEMAAELGCEHVKLVIVLERLVRKHLAERSEKAFRLALG